MSTGIHWVYAGLLRKLVTENGLVPFIEAVLEYADLTDSERTQLGECVNRLTHVPPIPLPEGDGTGIELDVQKGERVDSRGRKV